MADLSAERLLEAGGSAEAEVAAGGHGGEGLGAPSRGSGEGEAATNYRKRFCSPQVIKTSTQIENSQLQLGQNSHDYELIKREGESDSTSARIGMRFPKPTGSLEVWSLEKHDVGKKIELRPMNSSCVC